MGNVQKQLDVTRVGFVEDALDIRRRFAESAHMIVIANIDAHVRRTLADLSHGLTELAVIVGDGLAAFRHGRISQLQVMAADIADKLGVARVTSDLVGALVCRAAHVAARQRDEFEMMLAEQIAQGLRS